MNHARLNRQLTVGIVIALILGFLVIKTPVGEFAFTSTFVELCRFVGKIFVLLLKMVAVPLVFFSVFCGITNLGDMSRVGSLGKHTVQYYLATTFIAVFIGLLLVNIIQPGANLVATSASVPDAVHANKDLGVMQLLINQISSFILNPFKALSQGTSAMMAIILVSVLFGIGVLRSTYPKKNILIDGMNAINDAVMQVTILVLYLAPVGVFAILVRVLYDKQDAIGELFRSLGLFALTSLLGLAIHGFVVLPLIVKYLGKRSLREFYTAMQEPMKVAFGTDSSLATMPVTLNTVKTELGVSERTANFVVPVGATVNMDGTALYEAVCAMFIAQALGMDLSFFQQIIIFITATIAGIGAAGIPSAGLVTLVIVLNAVGIPYELAVPYIGMIFTIDRFIDMCRTVVNIKGDAVGAIVIDRWQKD